MEVILELAHELWFRLVVMISHEEKDSGTIIGTETIEFGGHT